VSSPRTTPPANLVGDGAFTAIVTNVIFRRSVGWRTASRRPTELLAGRDGAGLDALTGAQGPHIVRIPGTGRLERIEENLCAADVQLTAEDLAELDRVSTENQVQGDRYPEQMQRLIDR
jgi:hypothetical protein